MCDRGSVTGQLRPNSMVWITPHPTARANLCILLKNSFRDAWAKTWGFSFSIYEFWKTFTCMDSEQTVSNFRITFKTKCRHLPAKFSRYITVKHNTSNINKNTIHWRHVSAHILTIFRPYANLERTRITALGCRRHVCY
jgi:hypothetical protein